MNTSKSRQSRFWKKWIGAGAVAPAELPLKQPAVPKPYSYLTTLRKIDEYNRFVYGTTNVMHIHGVGTVRGDDPRYAEY